MSDIQTDRNVEVPVPTTDLAREITEEFYADVDLELIGCEGAATSLAAIICSHLATQEAEQAAWDAKVLLFLQEIEYALSPSPKWTDEKDRPLTQQEVWRKVRELLALLEVKDAATKDDRSRGRGRT